VPFFLGTNGYGILVNTTHRVLFDMAKSDKDSFFWRDRRETIDYYLLAGTDFKALLRAYTDLTGKPKLPPLWAFGLWYLFRDEANDWEVIQTAERFRQEGIPCDVLGLEPGWMETNYDLTPDKKWHPQRFPIPSWKKPLDKGVFIRVLKDLGYKFELWLCNDYDLSWEAERRIGSVSPGQTTQKKTAFHPDGIVDERLAAGAAAGRTDKLTRPDEPWFEHLKKFVDQGADFFKMDACAEVFRHSDHIWGNGMADAEMHNLYPLLYSRQMHEGFEEHTGRRGLAFNPCGWAGLHAWSATWTGDIGGKIDSLGSILNLCFAAQSWNTNDMDVTQPEMFHFSYLLPIAQINGYGGFCQPWLQKPEILAKHVFYSRLRARLIPYIYTWARHSTETGCPLVRPLPLEYPEDRDCRNVLHQYLLGRDLMVVAAKREAYFPVGRWKDFWTGELVEGGKTREISWPEDRAGGLYLREGAIVPLAHVMQYRGDKQPEEMELLAFPAEVESVLDLYEDDGVSLRHMQGESTVTPIRVVSRNGKIFFNVGESVGNYSGLPAERRWAFRIALSCPPKEITVNGNPLSTGSEAPARWMPTASRQPTTGWRRRRTTAGPTLRPDFGGPSTA